MGKRGTKPKGKVKIRWSPNFAYAIGLLATDGCLSKDGRHIDLTSKDEEQLKNFLIAPSVDFNITSKHSSLGKKYQRVQFSDVLFHDFLLGIGFTPAKSKTIGIIKIPGKYFLTFSEGALMGMEVFIPIMIHAGNQVLCFIQPLFLPVKNLLTGYARKYIEGLARKGMSLKTARGLHTS